MGHPVCQAILMSITDFVVLDTAEVWLDRYLNRGVKPVLDNPILPNLGLGWFGIWSTFGSLRIVDC